MKKRKTKEKLEEDEGNDAIEDRAKKQNKTKKEKKHKHM
jgi:hypothetical protein